MLGFEFDELLQNKMALMEIKPEFKHRNVNEGHSGGEKKRNEVLQMAVLDPKFSILDETDSGLDIDAMKVVARGVNKLQSKEKSLLLSEGRMPCGISDLGNFSNLLMVSMGITAGK